MSKRILIAPLNWGLGHATRCIPIINALIEFDFMPVIASDGFALSLLQKEFPDLESFELPTYNIKYSKKGSNLKFKLLVDTPKILKAIKAENKITQELIKTKKIVGIISDNRFGVYCKDVPCVFLTHQLKVLSGYSTWLSTKLHQNTMKNFDECWVPDYESNNNLSGKLSHTKSPPIVTRYIGPLSRFNKKITPKKYSLMVLLSGPEPQRTILEEKLLSELKYYKDSVIFIKGIIETEQKITIQNNLTIYNFMTSLELEKSMNESELVLSRSGYTTIMDLNKLGKKAFFIPTPGQFEQEYLAKYLEKKKMVPFAKQNDFTLEYLKLINHYSGFTSSTQNSIEKSLFSLFECE